VGLTFFEYALEVSPDEVSVVIFLVYTDGA
jgi:hypothetical protein